MRRLVVSGGSGGGGGGRRKGSRKEVDRRQYLGAFNGGGQGVRGEDFYN